MLTALLYVPGKGFETIPDPCTRCGEPRDDAGKVCSYCRAECRDRQKGMRLARGGVAARRRPCGCGGRGPHRLDCRRARA